MRIKNLHNVPCSIPGCTSTYIARKKDWICGFHLKLEYNKKSIEGRKNWLKRNQKPIKKVSKSMEVKLKEYSRRKKEFMSLPENKYCPVYPNRLATEVHHSKGRIGSLLLNTEFWIAVSSDGHKFIHENDSWSRRKGYLKTRM